MDNNYRLTNGDDHGKNDDHNNNNDDVVALADHFAALGRCFSIVFVQRYFVCQVIGIA